MEQNARSGRTNRLLARFAKAVVTQFPEARHAFPGRRVAQLGNPVRTIRPLPRGEAPSLRVLIAGGSLSAKSLNDLIIAALPSLVSVPHITFVHLAGEQDRERVAAAYSAAGVAAEVLGFSHDMPAIYDHTDVAITRAGATTVAELCAAGIPALYIPLPWAADDHQTANAQAVTRIGGAVVLPQATTTPVIIAEHIRRFAANRALVTAMGAAAHSLARPQAAQEVAQLIEEVQSTAETMQARRVLARRRFRQRLLRPLHNYQTRYQV
jgi:UDP-N-acetylglucosamine--N-acetylmuramyl-(pentapeptide) pyrophosphoryl-undecaprenol N-acetylglucosamine transferase